MNKNKITELFSSISNEELKQAIKEIKEDGEIGIIRFGGVVRKYTELTIKITGDFTSLILFMTEINLLREAAYRWIDTRDFPEFNG